MNGRRNIARMEYIPPKPVVKQWRLDGSIVVIVCTSLGGMCMVLLWLAIKYGYMG